MKKIKEVLKWSLICLLTGLFGGIIGALFSHSVSFVTNLRNSNPWLLYFLPVAGLLTVLIYKTLKTTGLGTNNVLKSLKEGKGVSSLLLPAVFSGAVLTHLCGGSAGREGAALQMGGGFAKFLSKIFKLDNEESKIAVICGMAAFFSALFGTPLGAGIFVLEVVFNKKLSFKAFIPSLVSSFAAFIVAQGLLVHPERFNITLPAFSVNLLWKIAILMILASGVCLIFVNALHFAERFMKRLFKNHYLKITVGAIIIIALTFIVGSRDYNGGGLDIVEKVFSHSEVKTEAFLLKILFTAITVAAGFKGGEIVPTIFIGATFGGAAALILGLGAPFGAALGVAVLFCGATNCPFATVLLCSEMFGFKGILYFAAASLIATYLTGKKRLYNV
ncbi:MAG: chloride channel protein [Clostridia bacterium]|nr:chloride channel protein [Clostridia bacterium]